MIRLPPSLFALLAAGLVLATGGAASAQAMDETEMMRFLVQAVCVGADGRPTDASPADPTCVVRAAQTPDTPATYRKHDWPGVQHPSQTQGYQVTDAVLSTPPRTPGEALVVTQTFDFGGGDGRTFGVFDGGNGDGGQVIAIAQGVAAVFMTQDGGAGLQWFVGDGCRTRQRPAEAAWLLFNADVSTDGWRDEVARLSTTARQDECPKNFGFAYTRYVRTTMAMPFLKAGASIGDRPLDVIVSEHYDLPKIAEATHLERFFLARDLGMVRWERWEHEASTSPQTLDQSTMIAASRRCPSVAMSTPPAEDWLMVDCRTWTNMVAAPAGWSVRQFGWTGTDAQTFQGRYAR